MVADHGLSERKLKILHAIILELSGDRRTGRIQDHIQVHRSEFKSATIRNEMADLEELGLHLTASYVRRTDPFGPGLPASMWIC